MKKYILGCLGALMLVGCGARISDEALEATGLKGAPKWVLEGGEGKYSAVGDAPIVSGNVNFARTEANAIARSELNKQIGVNLKSFLEKQTKRDNGNSNEKVIETIQESAKKYLIDTQPSGFWINDSGSRVYVLIKLSEEAIKTIRKTLKDQNIDIEHLESPL